MSTRSLWRTDYGFQPGDRPAKIGREEQQARILEAVLAALQELQR